MLPDPIPVISISGYGSTGQMRSIMVGSVSALTDPVRRGATIKNVRIMIVRRLILLFGGDFIYLFLSVLCRPISLALWVEQSTRIIRHGTDRTREYSTASPPCRHAAGELLHDMSRDDG